MAIVGGSRNEGKLRPKGTFQQVRGKKRRIRQVFHSVPGSDGTGYLDVFPDWDFFRRRKCAKELEDGGRWWKMLEDEKK